MNQTAHCTRFAEILQAYKTAHPSPEQAIDQQDGLAAQWREATLSEFNQEENADLQEAYWLQAQTWHILAVLSQQRLGSQETGNAPEELVKQNPHVLPAKLVDCIIDNDSQLREWIAIKRVLEDVNPMRTSTSSGATFRSAYLPDTYKEIERLQRLHGASATTFNYDAASGAGIAMSLDLDSNLRETGVHGAGSWVRTDAPKRENALSAIYLSLRKGDFAEAEELCRKSGEAWRVASIRGGQYWGYDESGDIAGSSDLQLKGNLHRDLWKKACLAIASNTLRGYWHERFQFSTNQNAVAFEGDLKQVFGRIEKIDRDDVSSQAQDPYQRIQQAIILGEEEDLVKQFANRLDVLQEMDESYAILLTSFLVHFVLFRRFTAQDVEIEVANAVIQAYIQALQSCQMGQLVAIYAAELCEGTAEDSYAGFLRAMSKHATRKERRGALLRAQEQGLNVRAIAYAVIKPLISIIEYKSKRRVSQSSSRRSEPSAQADEDEIIRSLEWLTFVEDTYPDALHVANIYICWMFNNDNVNAVVKLKQALPADLLAICAARQQMISDDQAMDQDVGADAEGNDARIEQNMVELKFHMALEKTVEALDEAEDQWAAGPSACLPG
ncbi:hypothetical protein QFC19_005807 [Naganishia cerealis]|uniref:Uncharacterized protein n=1 Tax=Naganishia cerealis TaxID=610337 RepID=A0ACC2VM68_9TREE|nr:hypothetical protein QFC19_005807 [Naganishia cerealis]